MRRLLVFALLIVAIGSAFGQEQQNPPPEKKRDINKAGIKLGINASTLVGDRGDTMGSRTAFSAGMFYREGLGGIFGGQLEIRYVQMGGVQTVNDIELRLDYVRFGLQFKVYPLTSTLGANAFVGAEYAVLLNAQQQDIVDKDKFIDVADFYSSSDYGVHVGLGLDFDFGLTTDLRLYLGLPDISQTSESARNLSIQYQIGWGF